MNTTLPVLLVGQRLSFTYADKPRSGVVEKVGVGYVTVKLDTDADNKQYKTFHLCKMESVNVL